MNKCEKRFEYLVVFACDLGSYPSLTDQSKTCSCTESKIYCLLIWGKKAYALFSRFPYKAPYQILSCK